MLPGVGETTPASVQAALSSLALFLRSVVDIASLNVDSVDVGAVPANIVVVV
jgi:hypothetical protein